MSVRMFGILFSVVLRFPFLLKGFTEDPLAFLLLARLLSEAGAAVFVLSLGDRQEVHPSRPHTSHHLSLLAHIKGISVLFLR